MTSMRILLLSPYDAYSHKMWRQRLETGLSNHHWTTLTLPPRYFGWRIRSNSLTWAINARETLKQPYDLLIASSMTDLASLLGMVPALSNTPTLLYFHENQFAYPSTQAPKHIIDAQMVTLYAAIAADHLAFNSCHNKQTFLLGIKNLLNKMPDHTPKHLDQVLSKKCSVIPVPAPQKIKSHATKPTESEQKTRLHDDTINILWNHRWEHDKGPDRLYLIAKHLYQLSENKHSPKIRLYIAGQSFRSIPNSLQALKRDFSSLIAHWGYIDDTDRYHNLMDQCHIVLSTALHDFQGLSILEACQHKCIPIVPNRLAYPEFIPNIFRYPSFIQDPEKESMLATSKILSAAQTLINSHNSERPDHTFKSSLQLVQYKNLVSQYDHLFRKLIQI